MNRIRNILANYAATYVTCGWTGAVITLANQVSGYEHFEQKRQKEKCDQLTNRGTDKLMNRPTDVTGY